MNADERAEQDLQCLNRRVPSSDEKANYINHRHETQALNILPQMLLPELVEREPAVEKRLYGRNSGSVSPVFSYIETESGIR